jgi:signal transduction histidine kinase
MTSLDREGARTKLVAALLVVTLLVTAFIAFRAQMASTYHRVTAERVVRDWTLFAANELARRGEAQIEFYGAYPVLQMLGAQRSEPTTAQEKRAMTIVHRTFHGAAGEPALEAIVRHPPAEAEPIVERDRVLIYSLPAPKREFAAFETTMPDLIRFAIPAAIAARPLLPPSLAEGRVTNDFVFVRVSHNSRTIFTTRGAFDAHLGVRCVLPDGYLKGATLEVSIAPEASELIVFGGVPRPLRIYIVMLVISVILTVVAILQLARERTLMGLRTEFVASVSHELRTPLTQIRMFAETLLLDRVRSDDERRHALAVIDRESRRLGQLVDNILQFSRGERGRVRLAMAERDVAALVRETIDAFAPVAAARRMTIRAEMPAALVARVDDDAMRQIVLNLLDNAAKYGPDGQEIVVALEEKDGRLRLVVEDAGPGIPPRDRKRVWRRYVRLDRETENAIAGAGIGLAVVRELVRLHRGAARVEQGSRGARFVIEVPA